MKNTNHLALRLLMLASCFLFSCKKDSKPITPPKPPTGDLPIDLSYVSNNSDITHFELIISSLDGTVLLDTISSVKMEVYDILKTNDQRFNVTTIQYDSVVGQYTANTYTAVMPSTWTQINNGPTSYLSQIYEPPFSTATLHYYNAPAGQPYFINGPAPEIPVITTGSGTVDVSYERHTGAYTYLLFPATGQYAFHLPQTDADSVDLSHMDTTVKLVYNKPAGAQLEFTNLNGYMDTTDFTKYLWLYFNVSFPNGYDMEYPPTLVQKYEFSASWMIAPGTYSAYYNFATTVPLASSIPFLDESNYTIGSNQVDSFAIRFNNVHPSYYETQWKLSNKIIWNVFSCSDSTVQHPSRLFAAQKSQLLNGQSLSGFTLSSLTFENAQQGAAYDWWLEYVFTPVLLKEKLLGRSVIFQKTF